MSQNMKRISIFTFLFFLSKGLVLEGFWAMCGFEGIVALLGLRHLGFVALASSVTVIRCWALVSVLEVESCRVQNPRSDICGTSPETLLTV